jgi:hypothetical protein
MVTRGCHQYRPDMRGSKKEIAMFRSLVAGLIIFAPMVTASAQNYQVTRPWGSDGPAYITGPNGYRGELSSPYGSHGPSTYSDNANTLRPPQVQPLPPNPHVRPLPRCDGRYACY